MVPGTQLNLTATAAPGFLFLGWAGTGSGAYTGTDALAPVQAESAITEAASFQALPGARFNLSFQAAGLPVGTEWSVSLNGVGYASSLPSLTVSQLYAYSSGPQGQYALGVPPAYLNSSSQVRYIALSPPTVVSTNGTGTPPVLLNFQPEAAVTVTSTVGGSASATSGGSSGAVVWALNGTSVTLAEQAANGYTFTSWTGTGPGAYTGTLTAPQFNSEGGPVSELATFTKNLVPPTPHYSVTLNVTTPLASGTSWSVTFNGVGYSSTTSTLTVTGLLGSSSYSVTYNTAYSPAGTTQYTAQPTNPSSVHVGTSDVPSVPIGYATSYWVSITASTGGTASPNSGWFPADKTTQLNAFPTGTQQFTKWVGTGIGSYSGTNASQTITVGGPIEEVAQFQTPTHATSTTVSSIWQNVGVLAGLAIAGLVVGLVVGLVAFRQKRSPPESPMEEPSAPEGATG
ncbi:MAG: InlB B-repeat-containing protein, partial [Thermoplasmata archaeon]